ncbi:hypothetical protein BDR07DRAFT_1487639 [Suillus spraguei]|nr:hypothetical protein BDR07DRAFT_1487639 [Suillus spraguei]
MRAQKVVDKPATIIDVSGTIIAWYLPDALTETTQKEIRAATNLLGPSLEKSVKADGNWRYNQEWFKQGFGKCWVNSRMHQFISGMVSQGHEIRRYPASLKGPSSENILKAIARPAAIASGGTQGHASSAVFCRVTKPCHTSEIRQWSKELPQMPETLQYWASVFKQASPSFPIGKLPIIETIYRFLNASIFSPPWEHSNARMRRIVRHGVDGGEGDRIAWAWY